MYRMPNRHVHARALDAIYRQSKVGAASHEEKKRWEKLSIWNSWAVYREYERLVRRNTV